MFYPLIQNDQGGGYFLERNGTHVLAAIAVSSKKASSGKFAQMNQSVLCTQHIQFKKSPSFFLKHLSRLLLLPRPRSRPPR